MDPEDPEEKEPLGKYGEDRTWNGEWTSTVKADDKRFSAGIAIPWRTKDICHG